MGSGGRGFLRGVVLYCVVLCCVVLCFVVLWRFSLCCVVFAWVALSLVDELEFVVPFLRYQYSPAPYSTQCAADAAEAPEFARFSAA